MKTSALFVGLMAMVSFMSAHPISSADFINCREYAAKLKKDFSTIQLIERDLAFGTWVAHDLNGEETTYLFTNEGLVQILHADVDGNVSYSSTFWRVAEFDGEPFLVISDQQRKEKLFSVDQTCEGITLKGIVCGKVLTLDYQPLKKKVKFNLTKAHLIGEWTNVSVFENQNTSKKVHGAFFNYHFSPDGMYSCTYGSHMKKIKESGSWGVSKDGQFLLLHVTEDGNVENIKNTKVIKIAQVDDHGLIIEQVMKTNDINEFFGADNKSFTFIK